MKWILSLLGLAYLISPYDLFPDLFIGVGWIDDLIILGLLGWYLFVYRRRQYGYESAGPGGTEGREHKSEGAHARPTDKPRDPYEVLGVARGASAAEIRDAYLRLANRYHPDKVLHLGPEFRELAENRFKEIQAAYQELKANRAA